MFTLTFALGTLFFCGLLYHTQRRHVISEDSEEEVNDRQNESNRRLIDDLNE
jgi:hypothetical protein